MPTMTHEEIHAAAQRAIETLNRMERRLNASSVSTSDRVRADATFGAYPGHESVAPTTYDLNVASIVDTSVNGPASKVAHQVALDAQGHVIPPPGTETLGEALGDLPNDIGEWVTGWIDHLNFVAPLAQLANIFSGGALQWITFGLLAVAFQARLLSIGGNLLQNRQRGPVSLVYYRVTKATAEPVILYLRNSQQVEVRETKPDDQGNILIGVPAYHSGRARRGLEHLRQKAGLEYTEL